MPFMAIEFRFDWSIDGLDRVRCVVFEGGSLIGGRDYGYWRRPETRESMEYDGKYSGKTEGKLTISTILRESRALKSRDRQKRATNRSVDRAASPSNESELQTAHQVPAKTIQWPSATVRETEKQLNLFSFHPAIRTFINKLPPEDRWKGYCSETRASRQVNISSAVHTTSDFLIA